MSNRNRALLFGIVSAIFFFLALERYQEGESVLRAGMSAVAAICFAIIAIISFRKKSGDIQEP